MRRSCYALVGMFAWVSACTDVAVDRARRDEEVGHYYDEQVQIDIDDGLAVVRTVSKDEVQLWSSAPHWTATIQGELAETYQVTVYNVIAGSTLTAMNDEGEPLAVEGLDAEVPTRRSVRILGVTGAIHLELVPPNADTEGTFQVAYLSDIQTAMDRVQDIFERMNAEGSIDFVISGGDLTNHGEKGELFEFESKLTGLEVPFYATLGNHELFSDASNYQEVFGRVSYHFHYRGVAFTFLDSASATLAPLTLEWLGCWLDEDSSRTHVVTTHIPPIDPIGVRGGAFSSKVEAHQLIAKLAQGRVDGTFYGHIHSYYEFSTAGIPAYIAGGGGARPEAFDGIGRHFLVIRVGPEGLENVRRVDVD